MMALQVRPSSLGGLSQIDLTSLYQLRHNILWWRVSSARIAELGFAPSVLDNIAA